MNKKWFVGKKVSDFSQFNVEGPISGITLMVDDETEYSAGDDSGIVWEITNPYGTQQMANDILNAVKGKEYRGFHADNAVLDPSAELGDGVNVNGGYYMLGYKNVTFGPGHMAEISAPNNGELNHEYPYKSKEERTFSRKLADMRSSITKTREQILLEVSKTYATNESVSSSIQQTADSILSTVSATYATGESVSKVEQTANKINWLVKSGTSESDFSLTDRAIKLVSDTIDLSGFVTFSSLETQGKTTINGSNITTGELNADLIKSGKITSKNGKVYFDLTNNEMSCNTLKSAKPFSSYTGNDPQEIFIDIGYKYKSGKYTSAARIYRNGNEDYGFNFDPYPASEGGSTAYGTIRTLEKSIHIFSCSNSSGTGNGGEVLLETSDTVHGQPAANLYVHKAGETGLAGLSCTPSSAILSAYNPDGKIQITGLGGVRVDGEFTVYQGTKHRAIDTENYGIRLLSCYETPTPLFGDVGQGETDENGECVIFLDDVFFETVSEKMEYQVFLQKENEGDLWVADKTTQYFIVKGTNNTKFAWEVKAKQRDYEYDHLEIFEKEPYKITKTDYYTIYDTEINDLIKEREEFIDESA